MLFAKKCQFVLNLDLVKIRLEIMLNYFKERNEISLTTKKKQNIAKSKRSFFFSNGLFHAFGQNMPFFSLFRFDQNKTRNNAS